MYCRYKSAYPFLVSGRRRLLRAQEPGFQLVIFKDESVF
jgi:hypothetical protein